MGRPTLFLSDTLLEGTDWRQQDAIAATLVGAPRVRADLAVTKLMWVVGEASILAGFCFALAYLDIVDSEALHSLAPLVVVPLVAFAMTLIFGRLSWGYRFERYARLADRQGAELSGDPLALMAALHTAGALRSDPSATATRISALDRLRQRSGPWAPWADLPVPSAIPLVLAGRTLTTPLDSAPPPAPVPAEPYPARGPAAVEVDGPVDAQVPPLPAGRGDRG